MTQAEHIERLSQWLENWLLPTLSGNEAFILSEQIEEARKAAQQSVHLTGGESAPLQALSTPEHGSGLEADTTPPTSK